MIEGAFEPILVEFGSIQVPVSLAEACASIGTLHPVWASLETLAEVEAEVEAARLQTTDPPASLVDLPPMSGPLSPDALLRQVRSRMAAIAQTARAAKVAHVVPAPATGERAPTAWSASPAPNVAHVDDIVAIEPPVPPQAADATESETRRWNARMLRYVWATQQQVLWVLARVAAAEAIH